VKEVERGDHLLDRKKRGYQEKLEGRLERTACRGWLHNDGTEAEEITSQGKEIYLCKRGGEKSYKWVGQFTARGCEW